MVLHNNKHSNLSAKELEDDNNYNSYKYIKSAHIPHFQVNSSSVIYTDSDRGGTGGTYGGGGGGGSGGGNGGNGFFCAIL